MNKITREQELELPAQNHKLKPFDITFQVSSIDEAKLLLLMFESSPTLFGSVIKEIRDRVRNQGYIL